MMILKQSTAVTLKIGPFVDATDGFTPETGLTIAQADVKLSVNGGAFATKNAANGGTHDYNGMYGIDLNTTDTGTVGRMIVYVYVSGARPVIIERMIVPANTYDTLIGGTASLNAQITTGGITATSFATDSLTAAALKADAATEIATAVGARTVDGSYTEDQLLRLLASILLGKVSGMDANAPVFRDISDTKNRVTAAVDARGNRTSVTVNSAT